MTTTTTTTTTTILLSPLPSFPHHTPVAHPFLDNDSTTHSWTTTWTLTMWGDGNGGGSWGGEGMMVGAEYDDNDDNDESAPTHPHTFPPSSYPSPSLYHHCPLSHSPMLIFINFIMLFSYLYYYL